MAAFLRRAVLQARDSKAAFCPLQLSCKNLCHESDKPTAEAILPSADGVASQELKGFLRAQSVLESKSQEIHHEQQQQTNFEQKREHIKTFAELLEESPLTRLGDPDGAFVKGKIVKRVQDDLYIDFNGKFCCVCKVPTTASSNSKSTPEKSPSKDTFSVYQKGKFVIVKLRDYEMTARFMGYDKDMTLLEADAELVGPLKT